MFILIISLRNSIRIELKHNLLLALVDSIVQGMAQYNKRECLLGVCNKPSLALAAEQLLP
jgi:hypothetical protein